MKIFVVVSKLNSDFSFLSVFDSVNIALDFVEFNRCRDFENGVFDYVYTIKPEHVF